MIYYYFDVSIWIKRYYKEAGTEQIHDLFETGVPRVCATLGFIEVVATLSRKRKAGQFTDQPFQETMQDLERDWAQFLQIELDTIVLGQAKSVAQKFALGGADAIHLASALVLNTDLREENNSLIFVASDQELIAAAQTAGLQTMDPTQARQEQTDN